MITPKHHHSRRRQPRAGVSWTVWIKAGSHRVRHHTVDLSAHGAKLRPRTSFQPGTPLQLHMVPPEGRAMEVSGVVWRVDSDGFVVLFLGSLPAQHLTGSRRDAAVGAG
jgi:PilZ domain